MAVQVIEGTEGGGGIAPHIFELCITCRKFTHIYIYICSYWNRDK